MQSDEIGLVWFRRDLRLEDNPAWAAATADRKAVVPLFVLDPRLLDRAGPFRRRQLMASLQALDYELFERVGGRLHVRAGDPVDLVPQVVARYKAGGVYWNADVTPYASRRDERVSKALDVPVQTSWGTYVRRPGSVVTAKGTLHRVFSSFYKAWTASELDVWPTGGEAVVLDHPGDPLPRLDEPARYPEGEREAWNRLEAFLERVDDYDGVRDRLDRDGTSSLSSDLSLGTVSPRAVVDLVGDETPGRAAFVRQIAWRDWYGHLLFERPDLPTRAVREKYELVEWRATPADLSAWKGGFTGIPVVDAAMRQLRTDGTMHNRARIVAASFLVKNLLIDWRVGEAHFRHLLIDADIAQNVGNWQWVAGTGLDAAPYNRIFNPVTQSRKFDPDGTYLRRWLPELAELDDRAIHAPWEASDDALAAAGVTLGETYPAPMVDLTESRQRALDAYAAASDAAEAAATVADVGAGDTAE